MDLQWDMNTWNSHLASSCWCGVSLHLPARSSVMRGCIWGLALTHWTLVCKKVKNSYSLSGRFPCAFVCIPEGLFVCLRVCTVNTSLWAVGLSRKRSGCENSWGIRRWFSLQPKRWDLHTAQSPDTHSPPVPRWTCICMQSCTHTHKGLFHLHRLPHTFQVISSSVSHFSSQALHLKQTTIIHPLIYSQRERERESCVQIGSCSSSLLWYNVLPTASVHYTLTQQHFKPYLTRQIEKLSTDSFFQMQECTDDVHTHTGRCPVKPLSNMLRCLSEHKEVKWQFSFT